MTGVLRPAPILAVVMVLALSALGAMAQTVGVRSGEHDGFTRLVLDIGTHRDWSLSGTGDSRRLSLTPAAEGYEIGQVFDLIPRSRLAALEVDDGLILSLACPCDVSASRYQGRYLVLDIAAAPAAVSPLPAPDRPPSGAMAIQRGQAAAERLPDMSRVLIADTALTPAQVRVAAQPGPGDVDMAEAARIMAEQLARAAASGLLSAAPLRPMSDADPLPDRPDVQIGRPPPPAPMDPSVHTLPLRAETALDAALHQAPGPQPRRNRLACTGATVPTRDWSSGAGLDQGLGLLRAAVFDDRDQVQRDAVIALAQHYLFYGFGAEAAFWLHQIEDAPAELQVIAALVDRLDGPHFPPEPDPLTCSDEELLWRYLDAAPGAPALAEDQAGRVQRATAALPPVLRDQIAPRIARALFADGHLQAARNLRDMLARGGRLPDAALLMLDLDLGGRGQDDAATRATLAAALRDDGGDPVTLMAHALALDRDMGVPVSGVRLGAAEALLREHGLTLDTVALWQEVMLAHGALGAVDPVLDLLAGGDRLPATARDAALTMLFTDRLDARDTAALFLLVRTHGTAWRAEGSVAGRTRVGVIGHLRDAGLFDTADILRREQRPLILPIRPPPAPDPGEVLRDAWHGGDWALLGQSASGPHHEIALRMATSSPAMDPGAPLDLPALAARVADSRDLRQDITALLAAPVPIMGAAE